MSNPRRTDNLFISEETAEMFRRAKEEINARRQQEADGTATGAISTETHKESPEDSTAKPGKEKDTEINPEPTNYTDIPKNETENIYPEKVKQSSARKRHILKIIPFLIGAVIVSVYLYGTNYYKTRFFRGTSINKTNVSNMEVPIAKSEFQKIVSSYNIAILERDNKTETITGEQLDLTYIDNNEIAQKLADQNPWKWPVEIFKKRSHEIQVNSEYNPESAKKAIESLACFNDEKTKAPENAVMKKGNNGKYEIIPEQQGTRVDKEKTTSVILDAIDKRETTVSLEDKDCYLKPEITSDDESLNQDANYLNDYLSIKISYQFGDNTETITGKDIEKYIENNGETVTVSTDWIRDTVKKWAEKYNTFGNSFEFTTHNGQTIKISGDGDYGWYLDQESTTKEFTAHIKKAESGEFEPVWLSSANGWGDTYLSGNYIEISLKEQKLWLYRDGKELLETDIVSGTPVDGKKTAEGCYSIDEKQSPGEIGLLNTQRNGTEVSYWLPFNGGQGIHDATWRVTFGGNEYQTNGSHGSINVPEEDMKTIYENSEKGMAVVVY